MNVWSSSRATRSLTRMASLGERYKAAMVLSGAGDSLGYKNGSWEFCHNGRMIYEELTSLGGLSAIKVKCPDWMVSDDTVMLLATGEALAESSGGGDREKLFSRLAQKYKDCMKDMEGRSPGLTCMATVHELRPLREKGYRTSFNPSGGGCGAAMRSMCIGLRYSRPSEVKDLVAVSVEAGRMTHNHPTGYLGSLASALFTSFALQGKPLREWGRCLLDTLPLALAYVQETGHAVDDSKKEWSYFTKAWTDYLTQRNILDGKSDPVFPQPFGFPERDQFYKNLSYSGWGGSSGHDAPMIAYDALLGANWDWEELCKRGMFHGGDSDSTGVIAACCYGATRGFQGVPKGNYMSIEYFDRLVKLAKNLLKLAYPEGSGDDGGDSFTSAAAAVTADVPSQAAHDSQKPLSANEGSQPSFVSDCSQSLSTAEDS